jgi:hypothetical protein
MTTIYDAVKDGFYTCTDDHVEKLGKQLTESYWKQFLNRGSNLTYISEVVSLEYNGKRLSGFPETDEKNTIGKGSYGRVSRVIGDDNMLMKISKFLGKQKPTAEVLSEYRKIELLKKRAFELSYLKPAKHIMEIYYARLFGDPSSCEYLEMALIERGMPFEEYKKTHLDKASVKYTEAYWEKVFEISQSIEYTVIDYLFKRLHLAYSDLKIQNVAMFGDDENKQSMTVKLVDIGSLCDTSPKSAYGTSDCRTTYMSDLEPLIKTREYFACNPEKEDGLPLRIQTGYFFVALIDGEKILLDSVSHKFVKNELMKFKNCAKNLPHVLMNVEHLTFTLLNENLWKSAITMIENHFSDFLTRKRVPDSINKRFIGKRDTLCQNIMKIQYLNNSSIEEKFSSEVSVKNQTLDYGNFYESDDGDGQ